MKFKFKAIKSTLGNVFLRRWSFYFKNGSLKIHLITGDDSPVFHTHPWDFTSFILFGGYKEFYPDTNPTAKEPWNIRNPGRMTKYLALMTYNQKKHNELHRVELFTLFGFKIPCLTIGWYSNKIELCSFCKEAGHCLSNVKP